MAWTTPTSRTTGFLITAAIWNSEHVDNLLLLKTSIANDGTLASTGGVLTAPELRGYSETAQTLSISAGNLPINYNLGNHGVVALNANITSITVTNMPGTSKTTAVMVWYIADGTPRTITHTINTVAARWPGGVTPTMTSTNGKIDKILYSTFDNGSNWFAEVVGQNF